MMEKTTSNKIIFSFLLLNAAIVSEHSIVIGS